MPRSGALQEAALSDDLRRFVRGEVFDDDIQRLAVSTDFGGLVHRTPAVAVRPVDTADVAHVVEFAAERGLTVTTRGAGHSQGGQSLGAGGILLDTCRLDTIGPLAGGGEGPAVKVGAGARWAHLLERTSSSGLVPPVLTNNPWASVGGTLSTAGIGTSSFRYGSQAENCLALEVVTGTGEILRCSPDEQPDLFRHALCGLGQFAVLTRVEHALRPHRRSIRSDVFVYDDLDGLVDDLRSVTDFGGPDYVDAFVARHPRERSWLFPLRLSSEVDDPDEAVQHRAPHARRHVRSGRTSFADFLRTPEGQDSPTRGTGPVHPWTDAFLPWAEAGAAIRAALRELPWDLRCSWALRPVRANRDRTPLLALPEGDTCLGFGVFPVVPRERAAEALAAVDRVRTLLVESGGRPYLSGWGVVEPTEWSAHHGAAWERMNAVKRRFDPHGILNPDISFFSTKAVET